MNAQDLDDLFAAARATAPEASPALLARVMQDALDQQPASAGLVTQAMPPRRMRPWAALSAVFGGSAALAGLASATLAGLWIGFAQPAPVTTVSEAIWQGEPLEMVELIPSLDGWLTEG